MNRKHTQPLLAVLVGLCLLASTSLAYAEGAYTDVQESEKPDAGIMLVDFLFLRPLGLAATVVGTATFLASLIVTLPTKSVNVAAKKLVVAPAKYTFTRPLGQTEFRNE